jgi:predicted aldo/keto reductase-like oxidoreductase
MKYRQMGTTDVYLSVISLGGLVMEEAVHHYAIDHGVNTVHMADDYLGGQAVKVLGRVLRTRRDRVYVALKDSFDDLDAALRALNTDYVDFLMFNRHSETEAQDSRVRETFERYRKQGKVRFCGLTSHENVKTATRAGVESGMYSIVMPALNQPSLEAMDAELRLAQQQGVAVMAMKTTRGLRDANLQLAFAKRLWANPAVTTVLKGIGSLEMFDAWLNAAQETLTADDDRRLYRHAEASRSQNCMMCGECRAACPYGVEIPTVLRCKDYYLEQASDPLTALATFRGVLESQRGDARCRFCDLCEKACPNGIPIVERLEIARGALARLTKG